MEDNQLEIEESILEVGISPEDAAAKKEMENTVEAVLFALGRAVTVSELAKACHTESKRAREAADRLVKIYDEKDGGLIIRNFDDKYELCSSPKYFENLVDIVSTPKKPVLTDVMMETLAIIAYKNPATKVEIEKIRGVKSDFAVNKLVEYGLCEEAGRLNAPGHPILFKPTDDFYRRFGVSGPSDMPKVGPEMESRISDEVQIEIRDILADMDNSKDNSKDSD